MSAALSNFGGKLLEERAVGVGPVINSLPRHLARKLTWGSEDDSVEN